MDTHAALLVKFMSSTLLIIGFAATDNMVLAHQKRVHVQEQEWRYGLSLRQFRAVCILIFALLFTWA